MGVIYYNLMILLLLFSFVSGIATIAAPCIWPILPIILSSSVLGTDHKRPLGITLGIMLSFGFFTLVISALVKFLHINPDILRLFAVIVIATLGVAMIFPSFNTFIEVLVSKLTGIWIGNGRPSEDAKKSGFFPGFVTGISLGIVWSPCAGPILAAIATLASTGMVTYDLVAITIAYVAGIGVPLFLFAYGGQKLASKARFISRHGLRIQQIFGVITILTALAIYTNYDKVIQVKLLGYFPSYTNLITNLESNSAVSKQLQILKGDKNTTPKFQMNNSSSLLNLGQAPEFAGISNWLNTQNPLTLESLRGKVILVDFWTYTCINCIRTLPHVTSWYEKYKDQGFVVIGIHTPEFEFEKNTQNVQNAISQYNIHYPVAQDNNYSTWNAYNNQYWPAKYLIDAKGNVRRTHFGEGEYDKTEAAIQILLKEAGNKVSEDMIDMVDQTPKTRLSPETYLGADRMQYFYPGGNTGQVTKSFNLSQNIPQNSFSLGGNWTIGQKQAISGKNAVLEYNFEANKVFLVLRPGESKKASIKVYIDGKLVDEKSAGNDAKEGIVTIDTDRLYNLINLKGNPGKHLLKLEFQNDGIEAYAFTFG